MDRIKFEPEPPNGFYSTLKKRVHHYFKENKRSRYANHHAIIKSLLFTSFFVGLYFSILQFEGPLGLFFTLWFAMGIFLILAAMSMVHDAAHGVYSRKNWVNQVLMRFANLGGGDGYMYKFKHVISHHPYTNIHGIDIDLEQSNLVRVTPYTKSRARHKHQDKYMRVFYPFYILFWILLRDFKYYKMKKIGVVTPRHASIHWIFLFFSKTFYVLYMIMIPYLVLPYHLGIILLGFLAMQVGSGVIAMFALLSNHVVEDSLFVVPDADGRINCSWGEHQMRTTDDYSPDSRIVSYFFSGLNHHIAHHLFPRYCHVHYPAITKILRKTAAEFGIRYRHNSIYGGLVSHFRLLRNLSKKPYEVT